VTHFCLFSATQALSLKHPILKTRVLLEGSQKAKWKAVRRAGMKAEPLNKRLSEIWWFLY